MVASMREQLWLEIMLDWSTTCHGLARGVRPSKGRIEVASGFSRMAVKGNMNSRGAKWCRGHLERWSWSTM